MSNLRISPNSAFKPWSKTKSKNNFKPIQENNIALNITTNIQENIKKNIKLNNNRTILSLVGKKRKRKYISPYISK